MTTDEWEAQVNILIAENRDLLETIKLLKAEREALELDYRNLAQALDRVNCESPKARRASRERKRKVRG